jgi:O-antigen ligase
MYPATSEIFEFNKMIFIYGSTVLIVFFWIMKMILNRKIILKKTPLDVPIALFVSALVLSTVFSIDVHTSIFGYYGRFNGGLLSILSYIALYYGFVSNGINLKKSLLWSLLSSVVVILWGLPGHFNRDLTCPTFNTILTAMSGKLDSAALNSIWTTKFNNSCWSRETNVFDPASRMFSTLGQPNWFGAYLAVNFFIGVYFFLKKREDLKFLVLNSVYLFLNFSAILFSRSRSAMLAVAIGSAIVAFYLFVAKKVKNPLRYLSAILVLMAIPIIFFKTGIGQIDNLLKFTESNQNQPVATQKVVLPSEITESFDIRKIVWKGALDLGLKYPLTGTGVETFAYGYFFTRPEAHNLTTEWDFIYNKAHNEYLNYFATTGFTGLFAYLGFLIVFIVYTLGLLKPEKTSDKTKSAPQKDGLLIVSLLAAWSTALVTNFFGFSTTTINIFTFLIPAFVISSAVPLVTQQKKEDKQSSSPIFKGTTIFLTGAIAMYALISLSAYFVADIDYGQGLYYSKPQVNDFQKSAFYFQEALKKRSEHVYEDKLSYSLAYLAGIASYQKNNEAASQLVTASEYYSLKSLKSSPKNVLYWKTRAKNKYLYYLSDQNPNNLNDGVASLEKAKVYSPTDPKIPYSLAVFYSLLHDLEKDPTEKTNLEEKTLTEINRSISLKRDFYDSYFFKGQFLRKVSRFTEAKEVFEYILKNINPNDEPTLQEMESF